MATSNRVASVAAFDAEGKLLFGLRRDCGKWTLPGGHLNAGEAPEDGARRELLEETGLEALELEFLGEGLGGAMLQKTIYAFKATVDGRPTGNDDPDSEMAHFVWVHPEKIPASILTNLHTPRNITLGYLGLLPGFAKAEADLDPWQWTKLPIGAKLYDYGADPLKLIQDPMPDTEAFHRQLRAQGYIGYRNRDPKFPDAVSIFRKLPVTFELEGADDDGYRGADDFNVDAAGSLTPLHSQLEHLLRHPLRAERLMALKMPGVTAGHLREALNDDAPGIAEAVLNHPACDESVLMAALSHPREPIRQAAAGLRFSRELQAFENRIAKPVEDDLAKGAMQRLAPFNPSDLNQRPDSNEESYLSRWQGEYREPEDRGGVGDMRADARTRALHKLSAATSVRRHPQTGEREYLLHRGVSPEEHKAATASENITHPDVVAGKANASDYVNHEDAPTSWTPTYSAAKNFGLQYAYAPLPELRKPSVLSAWVPESGISMVPKQYGALDPEAYLQDDTDDYKAPKGPNTYAQEHEVIVNPGHNSRKATPQELLPIAKPMSTLHGRINQGGERETNLGGPKNRDADNFRAKETKQRLQNRPGAIAKAERFDDTPALAADEQYREEASAGATLEGMHGFQPQVDAAFAAARFLTNGPPLELAQIREALWSEDDDYELAALRAYGLAPTRANLEALRGVVSASDLHKDEEAYQRPQAESVKAGLPEADTVAASVAAAFKRGTVRDVKLKGKHSRGSRVAVDEVAGNAWLLKPGSGAQSSAAGASEDKSSQSAREACFWQVANHWGIAGSFPEAQLLLIDGEWVAAIRLLPPTYKSLDLRLHEDMSRAMMTIYDYVRSGLAHRWGAVDYILGNPDRHNTNMMMDGNFHVLQLIDAGSAFAGESFDPAFDRNSFVPFYLRAAAPSGFNAMQAQEKLRYMPRVSETVEKGLRFWLTNLDPSYLKNELVRYGINPDPSLERLRRLQWDLQQGHADLVINSVWVTT